MSNSMDPANWCNDCGAVPTKDLYCNKCAEKRHPLTLEEIDKLPRHEHWCNMSRGWPPPGATCNCRMTRIKATLRAYWVEPEDSNLLEHYKGLSRELQHKVDILEKQLSDYKKILNKNSIEL